MFAICLSFLIFAGSTFKLIGKLIVSGLESRVGADLYAGTIDVRGMNTFVDDGPISEFLQQQKDLDGAVIDWTYAAPSLKYVLRKINNGGGSTRFADYAGYKSSRNNIYSVQENYLEVLDLKYYMPNELASDYVQKMDDAGRTIKRLPDG